MISCTEFIPAYSELFKFLNDRGGREAVMDFWEQLSDSFLDNLRDMVKEKGIAGCFEYWSHTLTEEAADFRMTLDEENGVFTIEMRDCPSRGRLNTIGHITPYDQYCVHCDVLYRRVLEPMGFICECDLSDSDNARCSFTVRKQS